MKKTEQKPKPAKASGIKQMSIDISAWEILIRAKDFAIEEGITHPSFSDAIRAMKRRIDYER